MLKFPAGLWADSTLTEKEFYQIIEYLIKDDVLAIPLSDYSSFDGTFKPQTIKIPTDPECMICVETELITLRWELPDDLKLKGSNSQIFVLSPDQKTTRLITASLDYMTYEITSEFLPGIYKIDVIYANEKFQAPSLLLTNDVIPKLPFWIKQDTKDWVDEKVSTEKFKDILQFLLKQKFIDIEPSNYITPEFIPSPTDKQILLTYFPTDLEIKEFSNSGSRIEMKTLQNKVLIQETDSMALTKKDLNVVTIKKPTANQINDLLFAFKVARYVKSNSIVFAKNGRTLGIGAGQMSRIDSTNIAKTKAKNHGISLKGCVMASEAFFPFRDNVDLAKKIGVTAIIQPGGSIKDQDIIDVVNSHKMSMVLSGVRVFKH